MTYEEGRRKFIQTWGTLGSSWGINRTMAQVHALLMISPRPLCADEIMADLRISRGNANMNIRALVDWGLAHKEIVPGDRRDFYGGEKDVYKVALQIMKERRKRELDPVVQVLEDLQQVDIDATDADQAEFREMVDHLNGFTHKADNMLETLVHKDEHWFYGRFLKMLV
ncbi:MAG: transcriptional regulator [Catalinimonas sp.]